MADTATIVQPIVLLLPVFGGAAGRSRMAGPALCPTGH